jgi:hypothetical protein
MEYAEYLREQAAKFRTLADQTGDPALRQEFRELADTCEQVAVEIEARAPSG